MLGQEPNSSLTATLFLDLLEEVAEWHLEGYGRGHQGGHCNVCCPLLHLDDVLWVNADGLGGLLLREPPLQAELPEPHRETL